MSNETDLFGGQYLSTFGISSEIAEFIGLNDQPVVAEEDDDFIFDFDQEDTDFDLDFDIETETDGNSIFDDTSSEDDYNSEDSNDAFLDALFGLGAEQQESLGLGNIPEDDWIALEAFITF